MSAETADPGIVPHRLILGLSPNKRLPTAVQATKHLNASVAVSLSTSR
jgi:hypothetical protein